MKIFQYVAIRVKKGCCQLRPYRSKTMRLQDQNSELKGNFYSEMQCLTKAEDNRYVNTSANLCYYTG